MHVYIDEDGKLRDCVSGLVMPHLELVLDAKAKAIRNARKGFKNNVRFLATREQYFAVQELVGKTNRHEYESLPPRAVMLVSMNVSSIYKADGSRAFRIDADFETIDRFHDAYASGDFSIFDEMPMDDLIASGEPGYPVGWIVNTSFPWAMPSAEIKR